MFLQSPGLPPAMPSSSRPGEVFRNSIPENDLDAKHLYVQLLEVRLGMW